MTNIGRSCEQAFMGMFITASSCRPPQDQLIGIAAHLRRSRDHKRLPANAAAMIKWAMMIGMAAGRLALASGRRPW